MHEWSKIEQLIHYSDEHLVVVHKPAGLLTLPDGYNPQLPCLVNLLKNHFNELFTIHRLDKETSGVIVFALTANAHRHLNGQFFRREVRKTYHAIVMGVPDWQEKTARFRLLPNGDRKHRTVVASQQGKPAMTVFRVLKRFSGFALLEARPFSGRRHQIRAHLRALQYPILLDELYGGKKALLKDINTSPKNSSTPIQRTALHAWSIEFTHPANGEQVRFQAPYPEDFKTTLESLENLEEHG